MYNTHILTLTNKGKTHEQTQINTKSKTTTKNIKKQQKNKNTKQNNTTT